MFGSRGARLFSWPFERCAGLARSLNWHTATLGRSCGLLAFVSAAASAQAGYSYTDFPADICATDSIYLDGVTPEIHGVTATGITYTVTHSPIQNVHNVRYIGFGAKYSTITIRFDKPMAATGAMLEVSGFGSFMSPPQDEEQLGLFLSESGYRGVVASPGSINEVTFATNGGVLHALRIDIRPVPVAADDKVQVFQNSNKIYDSGTLLRNDLHADAAVLVEGPRNAEKFLMHDDGSFVYQPAKNFEGSDSFSYRAVNGLGASLSAPATVEISVLRVNCRPEFAMGPNVACNEDDPLQFHPRWATQIAAGPELEGAQTVRWEVTTDRPDLFALQPGLDLEGSLSFQPMPLKNGVATVSVRLMDDGGLENGGRDASEAASFLITIQPRAHAPSIEPIMDCAVRAGDALVLNVRGTVLDPETVLYYSLDDSPEGATIDALSGQIIWRAGAAFAGQMPEFVVRATTSGNEPLSTTTSFRAEVLEVARPPEILPIEDLRAQPGARVSTKVAAKQSGNMRYFLASDVPGAMLNPLSGQFHWTATTSDAGRVVSFAVTAIDLAKPHLCAMKTFSVHVGNSMIALKKKPMPTTILAKAKGLQTSGTAAMKFGSSKKNKK